MAMLRVHLMQNWFGYSDPAMEEPLYETTIFRQFAGLSLESIPDETTILNFRGLLEKNHVYKVIGFNFADSTAANVALTVNSAASAGLGVCSSTWV
jgi:hypothetical protein